jgi:BspA type Leucine rich repeat region (6 copies)
MKKQLYISLALLCSLWSFGQTFSSAGINYAVTSATAPVAVKVDYNTNFTGTEAIIPATVSNAGTTYNVTSIGTSAFENCSRLISVTIPSSVTSIGNKVFRNCSGLTSVTIPSSVTTIANNTFESCRGLSSVIIPSLVTSIGISAFSGCSGLTSVTIPSAVTIIGSYAFESCSGLTSLIIPSSVTSIGSYAFYGCTGLTSVTVNWTTPLWIVSNVFLNVTTPSVRLNVPAGTVSAYQTAAVWEDFNPIGVTLSNNNFETTANNVFYNQTDNKLKLINNEINVLGNYKVYDINGKLIQKGQSNSNEIEINFNTKGVFIAVFENDTWKQSLKFVK